MKPDLNYTAGTANTKMELEMALTAFHNAGLGKQKHPIKEPTLSLLLSPLAQAQAGSFFKLVPRGEPWHFLKASKQWIESECNIRCQSLSGDILAPLKHSEDGAEASDDRCTDRAVNGEKQAFSGEEISNPVCDVLKHVSKWHVNLWMLVNGER